MATRRSNLYKNDVAMDVKYAIDDLYTSKMDDAAIERIISMIMTEYEDDDQSVAWLVAADRILKRGVFDTSSLCEKVIEDQVELQSDEVDAIVQMIRTHSCRKTPRGVRRYFTTDWAVGDIYMYEIAPEFMKDPAFEEWNVGFLCVGFYEYRGKHPLVYAFRTKCSQEDIMANPDIAIKTGNFWRACNWGNNRYAYMAMIWTERDKVTTESRFHYCGNTDIRPQIDDEFVVCDTASHPHFLWEEIESGLLRTRRLM